MNHKNFDWGYFLKHIAIIAVPVALQILLTTTGSMVDTIMLASIGEKAVGAVGLCAQFSQGTGDLSVAVCCFSLSTGEPGIMTASPVPME